MTSAQGDTPDVIIIGAGLSGIGAAVHLQRHCPGKSYLILEARSAMGGTWDLFRYPGIRSDSDMHTLGYSFKPWTADKSIADGPSILSYLNETVDQFGLDCTGQVQYCFNQQGFRDTKNFDQAPDYALFGCSAVFGIGVDQRFVASCQLPNAYNFGLAGNYTNHDIYQTIMEFLKSQWYSPSTQMSVVWTDRDQECLPEYVNSFSNVLLYHFFCGELISGDRNFKFPPRLDLDSSRTHMGTQSHKLYAKILWSLPR
jgi:hypothetical protein